MADKDPALSRDLTKFSSIISHLTLPLVVGKAVGAVEPSEALAKVGAFASEVIEAQWAERGRRGVLAFDTSSQRHSHNEGSALAQLGLEGKSKELIKAFELGVSALAIDEASPGFERAAQALSLHLCAAYERQDQPGLTFPIFGEGVRRSKSRVDGVTVKGVSGWRGAFKDVLDANLEMAHEGHDWAQEELDARELLRDDLKTRNRLDDGYRWLGNLRSVSGAPSLKSWASQIGDVSHHYGPLLGGYRFGVDLAGKQRAMAKAESPIPSLDRIALAKKSKIVANFSSDERSLIADAGRMWEKFVSSQCSLAALALAGDQVDHSSPADTQALRPLTPLRSAGKALLLRDWNPPAHEHNWRSAPTPPAPTREKMADLARRYKAAPLTFLAQLGFEIATDGYSAKNASVAQAAGDFLMKLHERSKTLGHRAMAIAQERQAEWLKKEGLDQAWAALATAEPHRLPSAKALNWAVANPETAALSGSGNKRDAFVASMARPLGVSAQDSQTLWSRVAERFAALGVDEETLAWASENAIGGRLATEAAGALPLRAYEKQAQLDRFALVARLAQASRRRGIAPKMALDIMELTLSAGEPIYRSFNTAGRLDIQDNLSASVPFKHLVDVKGAQELERQALAKKERLGWLLEEMVSHFAERFDKGEQAQRELRGELNAFGGNGRAPQIDWASLDPERHSWADVVYRRPAAQAAAMREAQATGGVPGMIAAACAPALGIVEASGGNDLIAQTREALKVSWGMNNAGWKNFLKAPAIVIEEAIAPVRRAESETLAQRKERLDRDQNVERNHYEGALRGFWISAMTQYNLPSESVHDVLSLINRVGHLGFNPVMEWGPFARGQSRGDAAGARFFIQEAKAKEERLPFVIKAICEQYAARLKTLRAEDPEKSAKDDEATRKRACALLAEDWRLAADWIAKSEDGLWQTLPAKPTWNNLWRAQKEWHDEMAAIGASGVGAKGKPGSTAIAWPSPLGRHAKGEWTAVELTNGSALSEEGREMGHCVSSYSSNCRSGQLRLFSIRFAGQRVCTMELRIKDGGSFRSFSEGDEKSIWAITQNKGKFNASVTDASALEFCEETRQAYQAAYAKKITQEKEAANKRAQERRAALKLKVDADPAGGEPAAPAEAGSPATEEAKPKSARARKAA